MFSVCFNKLTCYIFWYRKIHEINECLSIILGKWKEDVKHYKEGEWQDPRSLPFLGIQCSVSCSFCSGEGPATARGGQLVCQWSTAKSARQTSFSLLAWTLAPPTGLTKWHTWTGRTSEGSCFEPETRIIVIKLMSMRYWPVFYVKSH